MRDITEPYGHCSIDPISAMVGGIIPALLGGGGSNNSAPAPAPAPLPTTPPPQQQPVGSNRQTKPQQPSFLGAGATPMPQQTAGQKTLLGQ
jgi:hypothetical protein